MKNKKTEKSKKSDLTFIDVIYDFNNNKKRVNPYTRDVKNMLIGQIIGNVIYDQLKRK